MKPEDLERYRRLAQEARNKQKAAQPAPTAISAYPKPSAPPLSAKRAEQDPALEYFARISEPDSAAGTIYSGSFERLSDVPAPSPLAEMPKPEDVPMLESLGYSALAEAVRARSQADTPDTFQAKPDELLGPVGPGKAPSFETSAQTTEPMIHPSLDLDKRKGTPFTPEASVKAKNVVERTLELPGGRQEIPPGVAQQALEFSLVKKIHNARYGRSKDWSSLPEEERQEIRESAARLAKRSVAQVQGKSEQRGNVLIDLDPTQTIEDISAGDTWLGWLVGAAPTHMALKATMGEEVADKSTRWLAPFLALSTPGGRSVEVQSERPVMGVQKEGKLSWFFRLAPSTVIGAYFQPGVESWGDEAHLKKIYAEGYDVTQDLFRFGETYAELTPWVDSDLAKKVAGFAGVAAIVLLEPDASSLALAGVGKGFRAAKKMAGPARLLTDTVFEPTLKAWDEALASGKSFEQIEATLPADKQGPTRQLWRLFQAQMISRIMSDGVKVDSTVTGFTRRYPGLVAEAEARVLSGESALSKVSISADKAFENFSKAAAKAAESKKALEAARAARKPTDKAIENYTVARAALERARRELVESRRATTAAKAEEISQNELQQRLVDLQKLSGAVDDAFRQFESIAEVHGKKVDKLARSMSIKQQSARIQARVAAMERHKEAVAELRKIDQDILKNQERWAGIARPSGTGQDIDAVLKKQRNGLINEIRRIRAEVVNDIPEDLTLSAWGRWAAASEAYELGVEATLRQLGAGKRGARELLGKLSERTKSIRSAITQGGKGISKAQRATTESVKQAAKKLEEFEALRKKEVAALQKLEESRKVGIGKAQRADAAANRILENARGQVEEASKRVFKARAKLNEQKRLLKSLQNAPETARDVISGLRRSVQATSRLLREGKRLDDVGEFSYKRSISATAAGRQAEDVLQEMVGRYGQEAVSWARSVTPRLSRVMGTATKLDNAERLSALRELEEAAWRASRLAGDEAAAGKMLLRTVEQVPRSFGPMTYEGMLATGLRSAASFRRTVDPVLSRIGGVAPKVVREVYRRAFERSLANKTELNAIVRESPEGLGAAWDYILTNNPMKTHDAVSVGNRGSMQHADKALGYLRAVVLGDGWNSDLIVQAISRAALAPAGEGPQLAASVLADRLAEALTDMRTGSDLVLWIQRNVEQVTMGVTGRADEWRTTQRFVIEALLEASNQYDALFDMLRATGPGLDANVAKAMNFITGVGVDPAPLRAVSADQVVSAMNRYALPRTQQLQKPVQVLGDFFRSYGDGIDRANKLMKVAEIDGMGVYMPEQIRQALNGIPKRLAKQLEEFDSPGNPFIGYGRNLLQTWRIATVNGWVFPRAAQFSNTFFGDWAQLIPAVGFRAATKVVLGNAPAYIPFVGRQLQDKLSTAARTNSLLRAMFHPDLASVMRGADDIVVETGDGSVTARRFLREAYEDGMHDSMSSQDLMDITARSYKTLGRKAWEIASGQDVPDHIKKSTRMLESVTHRQRVLLYLEARTGRLTGTPMSRQAAKELVLENLYDWKLGTAAIEGATVAKIAAFWVYRRNMIRQLGAVLTEGFTAPGNEYLLRAMTGRTKLAKIRQTGQLLSAIPEAIYWQDPEETLDDAEQYELMGLRDAPWWANSASLLMNRHLTERRKLWYSEVQGRDVDFESILAPSLTTMDAIWTMTLLSQTGAATAVILGEQVGLEPRLTTIGAEEMWRRNVEGIAGMMMPGWEQVVRNILGGNQQQSVYGVTVPAAQAQLLYQMGWEPFMRTYRDPDGKLRYEVDANVMSIVGQLVSLSPQFSDIARNWANVANPSMEEGLTQGMAEATLRFSGLAKFSPHSPFTSRRWEVVGQNRELQGKVRDMERLTEVR